MRTDRLILLILAVLCCASSALAGRDVCADAAAAAAERYAVPPALMQAVTAAETGLAPPGGALAAWPWTVNIDGTGHWAHTRADAVARAAAAISSGSQVDIGCFQLNYRWHGHAFASLDDMFAPDLNADYAAAFLARLRAETGSWRAAAGAYHSRNGHRADRYVERLVNVHAQLREPERAPRAGPDTSTAQPPPSPPVSRAITGARGALIDGTSRGPLVRLRTGPGGAP